VKAPPPAIDPRRDPPGSGAGRDAAATAGQPWVGRALPRLEDARFLTGRATFVDDLKRPGQLHAVVVRSPHASARILSIDASRARALPGVVAVYTWPDIAAIAQPIPVRLAPLEGFDRYLQYPLARDRVRHVGEPVALIVADDRYIAEDALEGVDVEYDTELAVTDVHQAEAGAALVHPDTGSNVAARYVVSRGDPAGGFARAPYTRRETFRCHRQTALPMETRGLLAEFDASTGRLRIWGAAKVTFFNRRWLARVFGMDESAIELLELDVGGSFGVRGELYPEDFLVPFAALALARPVKWIEDRREHLLATNHSREVECTLEIACEADGRFIGLRGRVLGDLGAYVRTNGGVAPAKAAQFLPGPYRMPDCEFEVLALITNKTPAGTYRGPGRYEANFFRERLIDLAAADLGIDPATLRRINLIGPDEMPFPNGQLCPYEPAIEFDTGDYPMALERALAEAGYADLARANGSMAGGRLLGAGLACFVESSGAGPSETGRIRARADGGIDLFTACSASGQGHETVMAQIVADVLELPAEAFTLHHGSTTFVDSGYGTYHSRAVVVGGSALHLAGERLLAQARAWLARRHGLEPSMVDYRAGRFLRRCEAPDGLPVVLQPDTLAGIAALADGGDADAAQAIEAVALFEVRKRTYTYGTHVAQVAVDPETGEVEVLRFLAVEDIGRAVNPTLVHGQAVGAAVQGISATFLDELVYDDSGQLLTGTLADYRVATASCYPNIEVITLEAHRSKLNPLGVKGAGEGGIVATAAALGNAVAAALAGLGVTLTELPLSPERIARALREARAAAPAQTLR
jgi:carbon-monoxide dehydrogenase large subunit